MILCINVFGRGKDWIDIRSNGYFGSAYKFNGKEKDDETGYSYYGARYYTDRLSIWLSVDPLADKYPHLSPYAYCADNPVMLVDPDGRASGPPDRVQSAYNMIGIPYAHDSGTNRTGSDAEAMKQMDCTEFVFRVMADDGITDGVKGIAGRDATQKFFYNESKFEHDFNPQVGDVAGWEGSDPTNGHWGIVTEVGKNGTFKLTHARGGDKLSIENPLNISASQYHSGKFLGFFRPKVETPDGKVIPKSGAKIVDKSNIPINMGELHEVSVIKANTSSRTIKDRVNVEAIKPDINN